MERSDILARIEVLREEVEASNPDIIRRLIAENRFFVQKSHRASLTGKAVNFLRRRLLFEVERGIEPILSRQREINLRLLKEIENLRATLAQKDHEPSE